MANEVPPPEVAPVPKCYADSCGRRSGGACVRADCPVYNPAPPPSVHTPDMRWGMCVLPAGPDERLCARREDGTCTAAYCPLPAVRPAGWLGGPLPNGRFPDGWRFETPKPPPPPIKSVLQDWVMRLGLRHQGVLLTAVRGCDTAPKDDASKLLTRAYRAVVLNAFCSDPNKAATFITPMSGLLLENTFRAFRKNCDHYPHHYVMHLVHAVEIVGYKHPDPATAVAWRAFYLDLCRGLHVSPETEAELDARLTAPEHEFAKADKA